MFHKKYSGTVKLGRDNALFSITVSVRWPHLTVQVPSVSNPNHDLSRLLELLHREGLGGVYEAHGQGVVGVYSVS